MKSKFSSADLEKAIENSPFGKDYSLEYKKKAKERVPLFMERYKVKNDEAYGCCLALSYYTGVYSERLNRYSNLILKLGLNIK